jgi:outer membrane protein TolC
MKAKIVFLLSMVLAIVSRPAVSEEITLKRAVELALNHSTTMAVANADEKRAQQGYYEARSMYLPQLTFGSGVAYSHGFPLSLEGSAPSVVNVTTQQYLYNAAGRDYLKAAKFDWEATEKLSGDRRAQVILDTSLAYIELDKLNGTLESLKVQQAAAQKVEQVAKDRLQAGLDPEVELTKARLNAARVRLAVANAQGQVDLLRMKLGQLTGLTADSIETITESIPRYPAQEVEPQQVAANSLSFQAASQQADAKNFRAKAEHKMKLPQVDLAGQYGLFSKYNNYEDYFRTFQRHNVTFGLVIRFPFLNYPQKARAEAADAEAIRAKKEAEQVKFDVAANTLKLQRAIEQLAAARDVAKLEYQLAAADTQAVMAKVEAGAATIRDQENARLAENQKYSALLDMTFELDRAQMQLMRATGQIERWVLGQ